MKTNISKILSCIAVAGVCFSTFASAKDKLDLTAFKGNYTGTAFLVATGQSAFGNANISIQVPNNGNSATIFYSATFTAIGTTLPLATIFALNSNKTMTVSDLQFGTSPPQKPGTGTWSQGKRNLTFTATNTVEGITLTGTARAKDLRNKRRLTLNMTLNIAGSPITFSHTLRAKLPRTPRKPRR